MKVERSEHSVKLIPESDFEKECLSKMESQCIKHMKFEDAWERKGALVVEFKKHPWDEER